MNGQSKFTMTRTQFVCFYISDNDDVPGHLLFCCNYISIYIKKKISLLHNIVNVTIVSEAEIYSAVSLLKRKNNNCFCDKIENRNQKEAVCKIHSIKKNNK